MKKKRSIYNVSDGSFTAYILAYSSDEALKCANEHVEEWHGDVECYIIDGSEVLSFDLNSIGGDGTWSAEAYVWVSMYEIIDCDKPIFLMQSDW